MTEDEDKVQISGRSIVERSERTELRLGTWSLGRIDRKNYLAPGGLDGVPTNENAQPVPNLEALDPEKYQLWQEIMGPPHKRDMLGLVYFNETHLPSRPFGRIWTSA